MSGPTLVPPRPTRKQLGQFTVEQADAFDWLTDHRGEGAVVASPPDANELDQDLGTYRGWLHRAAASCFAASAGPTVFTVTDRLGGGQWLSKPHLLMEAAMEPLLWHKIALRRGPGKTDLHRPTYTHVLAFGPGRPGTRTPDVFERGQTRWANGAGANVAALIADYLKGAGAKRVLNPFCGSGTLMLAAAAAGLPVLGCDLDGDLLDQTRAAYAELTDGH